MNPSMNPAQIPVAVVGLGLMGCSITTCLLMSGHPVVAVAPLPVDMETAKPRIREHLTKAFQEGMFSHDPELFLQNLIITEDYGLLKDCQVVVECTLENIAIKQSVYARIEAVVAADALITSNTSAIPISLLQREVQFPARFFRSALVGAIAHDPLSGDHLWRPERRNHRRVAL